MVNFTDLCKYYKDCVFEDGTDAIFAEVQQDTTTFIRITGDELTTRNPIEFTQSEKQLIQNYIIETKRNTPTTSFWYGYPCSVTAREGKKYIKPIFFIPIKYDDSKNPIIEISTPRLNKDALADWGIEQEISKAFIEKIGLDNTDLIIFNISELANRFREYFPNLSYDQVDNGRRIYFRGAILSSEQSKYVQGLDKELTQLINKKATTLNESALKCFIEDGCDAINNDNEFNLKEIYELNENQKKAVSSAFKNKLTVVIGPPGTGKSQVVASIVVNAALNNEKVLLASKNHKAIQVVEKKLNKFANKPFIIRLGRQDGDRDLRSALIEHLNWLYNAHAKNNALEEIDASEKNLSEFQLKKNRILKNLETLRKKRNNVLHYFNKFEENIRILGVDRSESLIKKYTKTNQIEKRFLLNKKHKITAQYLKTLNDIHKLKYFETVLYELDDIIKIISVESTQYFRLWLETLPLRLDEKKRKSLKEFIAVLETLSESNLSSRDFIDLMNKKNRLMEDVNCFLQAWCVTNLAARGEIPLEEGFFDLVVIDESSQCDIASAIPLLYRAKRAVILGDPFQLKHITTMGAPRSIELIRQNNLNVEEHILYDYVKQSLYAFSESRVKKENVIRLNEHFRSHADIITFSKQFWYSDNLLISTDYRNLYPQTLQNESAVMWIDITGNISQIANTGAYIENEINCVADKVTELLRRKEFKGEIGVVTPFRHQANKIREKLNGRLNNIEMLRVLVDTAVKFQGDEKDIIIYSVVVADVMPAGVTYYHRETPNLLNVAITRARAKLIVIGNKNACLNSDIRHINEFAKFITRLENGEIGTIEAKAESPYEKILHSAMIDSGLNPMPQYPVGQYRLDFALIVGDKQIDIEVDGKEFHTDWTGERLNEDILRNQRLQNLGWKVLRFWSYEIKDKIDYCIKRIENEIKNN